MSRVFESGRLLIEFEVKLRTTRLRSVVARQEMKTDFDVFGKEVPRHSGVGEKVGGTAETGRMKKKVQRRENRVVGLRLQH